LTVKDASGKVTRSGVVFTLYSWIFEQEQATQGALFADPIMAAKPGPPKWSSTTTLARTG
jgi:hypothetical protein